MCHKSQVLHKYQQINTFLDKRNVDFENVSHDAPFVVQ